MEKEIKTPHIKAKLSDVSKVVIMPGDPLRSKHFAKNYLEHVVSWNGIRGMVGYTGTYNGKKISVHPSGMGFGSIGIYSFELFNLFGVETIIRMGTCGAYTKKMKPGSLVLGEKYYTNENFSQAFSGKDIYNIESKKNIFNKALKICEKNEFKVERGFVHSTNVFYRLESKVWERFAKDGNNCNVVEMESFAIACVAKHFNKNFIALLCVSDNLITGKMMTSIEREQKVFNLFKATREVAYNFA